MALRFTDNTDRVQPGCSRCCVRSQTLRKADTATRLACCTRTPLAPTALRRQRNVASDAVAALQRLFSLFTVGAAGSIFCVDALPVPPLPPRFATDAHARRVLNAGDERVATFACRDLALPYARLLLNRTPRVVHQRVACWQRRADWALPCVCCNDVVAVRLGRANAHLLLTALHHTRCRFNNW